MGQRIRWAGVLLGAAVLAAPGCGGSPAAPPPPIVSAPEPAPSPALPPVSQGCGLPPTDGRTACRYAQAQFALSMNEAIALTVVQHPEWFDLERHQGGWSYFVVNPDAYLQEVVQNLRRAGLCAIFDGAEVAVKNSNEFNEQYDIYTSTGFSRWGGGAYEASCYPAAF